MNVGVLGPRGRLGRWLVKAGAEPVECDVTDYKSIVEALEGKRFDVLYNCAAYTKVDEAELPENKEKVIWTNFKSLIFIQAALAPKTHMVHMSTDYVFGGKRGPYSEKRGFVASDVPANYYGLSKQAAEASLKDWPGVTIVRTTGLFGSGDPDFVTSVVSHYDQGNTMLVADNLWGNQTYIPYLANQLLQLATMDYKPPLVHLASNDVMTRYEFARMIAQHLGKSDQLLQPAHSEFIWNVPRLTHGGLLVDLSRKLGFLQYSIEDGLVACLESVVS
jgi:dTDP-4-dehydrorhamnose reductase